MAKKKIPANTGIYFELINTEPRAFIMKDNRLVDFRLGMPFNSLELYKNGFLYLGLKEGAEILFKQEKQENLLKYIQNSQRKEDLLILEKASSSEKVKKTVEEKLKDYSG